MIARIPLLVALSIVPAGLAGQGITWRNLVAIYGDNTEFFTPYREGETILGGQVSSRLVVEAASKYAVHVGVFGDVRWGSEEFLDRVRPIISFRYASGGSLGVLGTLVTERRHGYLDALEVSTLELTRPIEYGLQWIERRRWLDGEVYLNWQALNTREQREVFDYGWVIKVRPVRQVSLETQLHGLHHGGQLFDAGVPVTNNVASGFGVTLAETLPRVGRTALTVYRLTSSGNIDPDAPPDRSGDGRGTLIRLGVEPARGVEVFGIRWRGRDFLSQDGDNNYNSAGRLASFYRSRRKYLELGIARHGKLDGGVELDAEFRFHRIDDEPSIAIRGTSWEYSYRLVVRTPFQIKVR